MGWLLGSAVARLVTDAPGPAPSGKTNRGLVLQPALTAGKGPEFLIRVCL